MKIRLELEDRCLEFEREPMSKGRFKAVCCVLFAVLYIILVSVSGAVLGFDGAIITSFFGLIGCMGGGAAILYSQDKD